jgi:FkbM family methyltransferase
MNALRYLVYKPELRWLSKSLGVSELLSKWYCQWARPQGDILSLQVAGMEGRFRVHTDQEFRFLEAMAIYERQMLERLLGIAQRGDVFYDIGAHTGLYSVLLGKALGAEGAIVAFEPERENYAHLVENLELNQLTTVRAVPKALGDHSGEATLYLGKVGNLSMVPPDAADMQAETIEVVNGDRFVQGNRLPAPRLVKIDVEGYEYAVLQGLRQTLSDPCCELICCEIHPTMLPAGVAPEEVLSLIQSFGFATIETISGWHVFHAICQRISH